MLEINGISLGALPFQFNKEIGTLLYAEYPTTVIYADDNEMPIVKEWLDCEGNVDRYFACKTTKKELKKFINSKITLYELIKHCNNNIGFLIDEYSDNKIKTIQVVAPSQLPEKYVPSIDNYFEVDEGVDTDKIIDFFHLNELKEEDDDLEKFIKKLAKTKKSEIFNIHLKEGQGVRFGRVDTDILGATLLNFDNLYKEIVLDFHYGKNRGEVKIKKKEREEKVEMASTEVFISKAASFSMFLKPKYNSQIDLFQGETETGKIASNLFRLFEISKDKTLLEEEYLSFSDFVFKSYKKFLNNIKEFDFNLDVNWTNQATTSILKEDFNLYQSESIIERINNINTENTENFKVKGKFQAINCNTGHYIFEGTKEEKYQGYFDKKIKESIHFLTFMNLYEISIDRTIKKVTGSPEPKIFDKIIATYEINE